MATCKASSISDAAPIYDLATGKKSETAAYDDSFTVAQEKVTSAGKTFLEILDDGWLGMGILYEDTTEGTVGDPFWDLQC